MRVAINAINRHGERSEFRDPNDWYIEEHRDTALLLDRLPFFGTILDPACGSGRILAVCRSRGLNAVGSDLVERGFGNGRTGVDFTKPHAWAADSVDHIITNPPFYGGAGPIAFVERGLVVARQRVAILVPLPFLASQGRHAWFKSMPVRAIFVLSQRSSMPPGALLLAGEVEAKGGKEDYVWIVFERGYAGPVEYDWIMEPSA